jgi:hypothetical protein
MASTSVFSLASFWPFYPLRTTLAWSWGRTPNSPCIPTSVIINIIMFLIKMECKLLGPHHSSTPSWDDHWETHSKIIGWRPNLWTWVCVGTFPMWHLVTELAQWLQQIYIKGTWHKRSQIISRLCFTRLEAFHPWNICWPLVVVVQDHWSHVRERLESPGVRMHTQHNVNFILYPWICRR